MIETIEMIKQINQTLRKNPLKEKIIMSLLRKKNKIKLSSIHIPLLMLI